MPYIDPHFTKALSEYLDAIPSFFEEKKAEAVELVCETYEIVVDEIKYVGSKTLRGIEYIIDGVEYIYQETSDGLEYLATEIIKELTYIRDITIDGVNYVILEAKDGLIYVGMKTKEGIVFLKESFLTTKNVSVAIFASAITNYMTGNVFTEYITDQLLSLPKTFNTQKEFDGHLFAKNCKQIISEKNESGYCPSLCSKNCRKLKKIYYINGINTSKESMCVTMQLIAELTCAQVYGIYNATEGMGTDLKECLQNIQNDTTPAGLKLEKIILENLQSEPPKPVNIYAHSQGGLITQLSIKNVKQELALKFTSEEKLEQFMSKYVSIKSFGTVVFGWPQGPVYEHFTNISDPVPMIIASVQINNLEHVLMEKLSENHHLFNDPKAYAIESHFMDDVYLEKLNRKDCKCE